MEPTPGSSIRLRTRGGIQRTWVVPQAGTQRYEQLLHAIEVGDIALLDRAGEPPAIAAGPETDQDQEALRAEFEALTGKRPHPNMKPETLRERIDEARRDDDDEDDLDDDLDDDDIE